MERKLANSVKCVSLLCCSSVYLRMFQIPEITPANVDSRAHVPETWTQDGGRIRGWCPDRFGIAVKSYVPIVWTCQ